MKLEERRNIAEKSTDTAFENLKLEFEGKILQSIFRTNPPQKIVITQNKGEVFWAGHYVNGNVRQSYFYRSSGDFLSQLAQVDSMLHCAYRKYLRKVTVKNLIFPLTNQNTGVYLQ